MHCLVSLPEPTHVFCLEENRRNTFLEKWSCHVPFKYLRSLLRVENEAGMITAQDSNNANTQPCCVASCQAGWLQQQLCLHNTQLVQQLKTHTQKQPAENNFQLKKNKLRKYYMASQNKIFFTKEQRNEAAKSTVTSTELSLRLFSEEHNISGTYMLYCVIRCLRLKQWSPY